MRFILLGSDFLLWCALLLMTIIIGISLKRPINRRAYQKLLQSRVACITLIILSCYLVVALLDSIHFQRQLDAVDNSGNVIYAAKVESGLDYMFGQRALIQEKTYSAPFARYSYLKEVKAGQGQVYPPLTGINQTLFDNKSMSYLIGQGIMQAAIYAISVFLILCFIFKRTKFISLSIAGLLFILLACIFLESDFHILGTDKIGQDVFYQTIKSIRTGLVIGLLTTLVTLPFAVTLGLMAGYFGGWLDDVIQYTYITISSIPGVLLIAASVLSMQIFISNHPDFFSTLMARSDARLVALCVILGLTGWTSLCRVIRAETLKIREIDYIQAAKVLGSSNMTILFRHILPNIMHLILIAVVLDFSFLVLAEAVLSYIGVGVSPLTISWGNMINSARMELAREPLVWWPMLAAFILMFVFVISINLLADKLRDVFDPRYT